MELWNSPFPGSLWKWSIWIATEVLIMNRGTSLTTSLTTSLSTDQGETELQVLTARYVQLCSSGLWGSIQRSERERPERNASGRREGVLKLNVPADLKMTSPRRNRTRTCCGGFGSHPTDLNPLQPPKPHGPHPKVPRLR